MTVLILFHFHLICSQHCHGNIFQGVLTIDYCLSEVSEVSENVGICVTTCPFYDSLSRQGKEVNNTE